jgi:putative ABC transport system permease protein
MVGSCRVSAGYFDTLGVTLTQGRFPTVGEAQSLAPVVVLNESAAQLLFPDASAVGRQVTIGLRTTAPYAVVGVVADVRNGGPTASRTAYAAHAFLPFTISQAEDATTAQTIVIRLDGDGRGLAAPLRDVAQALGPRALVERIQTGEELFTTSVLTPRRRTVMLGLLGALGLVLAVVGVFGMTAYAVTRRTREIGLRLACGARPDQVVRTVLGDSALPVLAGALVGVGLAALSTTMIRGFLFETSPLDAATLAAVTVLLCIAGTTAALLPALRAARVDPVSSLRAE